MTNCVFPGYNTNLNNKKYDHIGLFKLTGWKSKYYMDWKENVVAVIKRYRVIHESLQKRIDKGNVWTCKLRGN